MSPTVTPAPSAISWPDDMRPGETPVYTYNERHIEALPAIVWAWLIRAAWWPSWYPNWTKVELPPNSGLDLGPSTLFMLTTRALVFKPRIPTVVHEFEQERRLGWRGGAWGSSGYHGWLIEPAPGGCRVITEETVSGWFPWLMRGPLQREVERRHDLWLERLAHVSRRGAPDILGRPGQGAKSA